MRGRPDYGKISEDYAVGFTEHLSYLTDEELAWIANPRDGLHTVCKFLPTPADVAEFIKAKREAASLSFRNPAPTGAYAYFKPDRETDKPLPKSESQRRAEIVRQALGYNPLDKYKPGPKHEFTEPTAEDIENMRLPKVTKSDLTPYLRTFLEKQGWPIIPASQEKAV